eukprot:561245-Amphidinium_carterae.1
MRRSAMRKKSQSLVRWKARVSRVTASAGSMMDEFQTTYQIHPEGCLLGLRARMLAMCGCSTSPLATDANSKPSE